MTHSLIAESSTVEAVDASGSTSLNAALQQDVSASSHTSKQAPTQHGAPDSLQDSNRNDEVMEEGDGQDEGDGEGDLYADSDNEDGFHDLDDADGFDVTLDFGNFPNPLIGPYKLLGLETETPFIQVGPDLFKGTWTTNMGTELVLDRFTGLYRSNHKRRIVFKPAVRKLEATEKVPLPIQLQFLRQGADGSVETLGHFKRKADAAKAAREQGSEKAKENDGQGAAGQADLAMTDAPS